MFRTIAVVLGIFVSVSWGFSDVASHGEDTHEFLLGDFDFDGDRDADDVNMLTESGDLSVGYMPGPNEIMFDLDLNNWIDFYDLVEWLRLGTVDPDGSGNGGTIIGDADLDGEVTREDLGILNDSLNNQLVEPGKFTLGDFDGNGKYDLHDLFLWNRGFNYN